MDDCENIFIREAIESHQKVEIHFRNKDAVVCGLIVDLDERTIKVRTCAGSCVINHQLIYKDSIERIVETL